MNRGVGDATRKYGPFKAIYSCSRVQGARERHRERERCCSLPANLERPRAFRRGRRGRRKENSAVGNRHISAREPSCESGFN